MSVRFTKMHGAGNDFVIVDHRHAPFDESGIDATRRQALADRHTGIGFDQMLVIEADTETDARVRIFNADGSEVGQCGNGLRCVAQHLTDTEPTRTDWRVAGQAGITEARVHGDGLVSVSMGVPQWGDEATACVAPSPFVYDGQHFGFETVSLGNPHAVIAVDNAQAADVAGIGAAMQDAFANGVNVGFAQATAPGLVLLRVYERGVGETRACGSGACAAGVVALRSDPEREDVTISLPGGQLMVRWAGEHNPVWLTGPAQTVFEGSFAI